MKEKFVRAEINWETPMWIGIMLTIMTLNSCSLERNTKMSTTEAACRFYFKENKGVLDKYESGISSPIKIRTTSGRIVECYIPRAVIK